MDLQYVIKQFEVNSKIISELVKNVSDDQSRWKYKEGWSILETINHLLDEEQDDFRARLKSTLEDPNEPWLPLDPPARVIEYKFNERNFEDSLNNFLSERSNSIAWLRSLENAAWTNEYKHPKLGSISASKILYNWLAHDYLHIRQITGVLFRYLETNIKPLPLDYAGEW